MKKNLLIAGACLLAGVLHGAIDLNNNGLSDVYEFIYFNGPADPFADPDGDGVSNYDEMFWGTNPTNALSRVTGPTATLSGANLTLTWPLVPYRIYTLEGSEDLVNWQIVASGKISSQVERLDNLQAPDWRFYRLKVTLEPTDPTGQGLADWEVDLYAQNFGYVPGAQDTDGDGLNDIQEFLQGHNPHQKDHPAVGLVVFTPLEK